MFETFEQLMKTRDLTAYQVCKDTGISQATISRWRNNKNEPSLETFEILANYFGVSLDYLRGKTKEVSVPSAEITMDDFSYALFQESKDLTQEQKDTLLGMVRYFNQQKENNKKKE